MLTSIVLTGAGDPITLNIADAALSDRYIFKGADGLGPPDVTLRMGEQFADGVYFQSRKSEARFPVFKVGLRPDYSIGEGVSELRDIMYAALLEGRPVTNDVQIMTTDSVKGDRFISGYVEKFEPALFTNEPEFLVSFQCPYPYFQAEASTVETVDDYSYTIPYSGTKSVGFVADFEAEADPGSSLEFSIGSQSFQVSSVTEVVIGDIIRISTIQPNVSAVLIRGEDDPINILDGVDAESVWPVLFNGDNEMIIDDVDNNIKIKTIEYIVTDWGV